jgi:hypothetical protein
LKDIRWHSLIHGYRQSSTNHREVAKRVAEAKALLMHIFNLPYEDCLKALLTADPEVTKNLLCILPEMAAHTHFTQHTVNALLEFKDRLNITDANWGYVCDFMQLGPHASLYHLRKLRGTMNQQMEPKKVRNYETRVNKDRQE